MKRSLLFLAMLPLAALAQDCKNYFYMANNAEVQMTMYDKKGKESGMVTWKISDVKKISGGFESVVHTTMVNDKGKELSSGVGNYRCENGVLKADARMSMPQQSGQSYNIADAKVQSAYIEYPSKLTVGQSLADVDFKADVQTKSGGTSNVSFKETNRKVVSKESITTPAGTWDAYVITYDAVMRTEIAGIGIPFTISGKEWFVPGYGIVKSETYNKNGKLLGSSQLTSVKK